MPACLVCPAFMPALPALLSCLRHASLPALRVLSAFRPIAMLACPAPGPHCPALCPACFVSESLTLEADMMLEQQNNRTPEHSSTLTPSTYMQTQACTNPLQMTSVNNIPIQIKKRLLFCRGHERQRRVWQRTLPRVLALPALPALPACCPAFTPACLVCLAFMPALPALLSCLRHASPPALCVLSAFRLIAMLACPAPGPHCPALCPACFVPQDLHLKPT